jgi:uncharacterized protein YPO0396
VNALTKQEADAFPLDGPRQQFRLTRIQTYNWGTFEKRMDVSVPKEGYLLIGASGSGKSTMLDASTALLTPPRWADYNAAARQQGDRHDRNIMTYVRGAWAKQTDELSGEAARKFLRTEATWSAVAHTYRNDEDRVVTLCAIFWIVGTSTASDDVKRAYLVFQRDFDLEELKPFADAGFDRRKLKQLFEDAGIESEFAPYQARFQRLLGIESDVALKLLHKTQAAKDQDNISQFLRDFMLDPPETFQIAKMAVEQFGELYQAHQAVVTAREQIAVLVPAREAFKCRMSELGKKTLLSEVELGLDAFTEQRRVVLLEKRIAERAGELEARQQDAVRLHSRREDEEGSLRDLQGRLLGAGSRVEEIREKIRGADERRMEVMKKRSMAEEACSGLGVHFPDNADAFTALVAKARELQENVIASRTERLKAHTDLQLSRARAGQSFEQAVAEVKAMETSRTNLPASILAVRNLLVKGLNLAPEDLPFAAELMQVRPDEQRWTGAIERVLRGFALTMLVPPGFYEKVSDFVNRNHLGGKLVYLHTKPHSGESRNVGPQHISTKLEFKGTELASWVRTEIRVRFAHECVETAAELRTMAYGVTLAGQVKTGARHEKDDRNRVDDQTNWVLGYDARTRLDLYRARAQELAGEIAAIDERLRMWDSEDSSITSRARHCQTLVNMTWTEVDVPAALMHLSHLNERLAEEQRAHPELAQLEGQIRDQEAILRKVQTEVDKNGGIIHSLTNDLQNLNDRLGKARERSRISLTPTQLDELASRFDREERAVTLENISEVQREEQRKLSAEKVEVERAIGRHSEDVVRQLQKFATRWVTDAEGLDASIEAAADYFGKLERLERDNLPAFEARFLTLLHEQSDRTLSQLAARIDDERTAIRQRLEEVNEGLRDAEYNEGTFIEIVPLDCRRKEVKEFQDSVREILSRSLENDSAVAEARFLKVKALVDRLRSQDPKDVQWRAIALDVRQHIEFRAREIDEAGREHEVYDGGSGKSGGQRQKLAATCLASALRYQLGGREGGYPSFGTVFIDEAFSKSDADFTATAVAIFKKLGFQPILATPMARVMALEPFIGGAIYIDIKDRKYSRGRTIQFIEQTKRLDIPDDERSALIDQEAAHA